MKQLQISSDALSLSFPIKRILIKCVHIIAQCSWTTLVTTRWTPGSRRFTLIESPQCPECRSNIILFLLILANWFNRTSGAKLNRKKVKWLTIISLQVVADDTSGYLPLRHDHFAFRCKWRKTAARWDTQQELHCSNNQSDQQRHMTSTRTSLMPTLKRLNSPGTSYARKWPLRHW